MRRPIARDQNQRKRAVGSQVSSWVNFTPLSLQPEVWLDASDSSTITLSGSSVTQWNDKSGNGRNVSQGTGLNQPTLTTSVVSGLNEIDFDGTNDSLQLTNASGLLQNVAGATMYCARFSDGVGISEQKVIVFVSNGTNQAQTRLSISQFNSKSMAGGRRLDVNSFQFISSASNVNTTGYQVQTTLADYANSDLFLFINDILENSSLSFQTDGNTSNTQPLVFAVGGLDAASGFFNGRIGEVLIYNYVHTANQRQMVWEYLALKWGIAL